MPSPQGQGVLKSPGGILWTLSVTDAGLLVLTKEGTSEIPVILDSLSKLFQLSVTDAGILSVNAVIGLPPAVVIFKSSGGFFWQLTVDDSGILYVSRTAVPDFEVHVCRKHRKVYVRDPGFPAPCGSH